MTSTIPELSRDTVQYDLLAKYGAGGGRVFLSGTQAMVRVIFEQRRLDIANSCNTAAFVSGYPGSPLGGFDRELSKQHRLMTELAVVHVPGFNEELAATAVWGSQIASIFEGRNRDGVVGVWYGKGPGLDRASDAIRHAQYVGTSSKGGVIAFIGDDPSCKSSSIPNTSERTLFDLGLPTLVPGGVGDILELGIHGVAMSRASGLWTGIRVTTTVADAAGVVVLSDHVPVIRTPVIEWNGEIYHPSVRGIPGPPWSIDVEAELVGPRQQISREYGYINELNPILVKPVRPWLGIMAVGHLYGEFVTALATLGLSVRDLEVLGVRVCKVRMLQPVDARFFREFADGLSEVFVIEEKRPLLEVALKDALYGRTDAPNVVGKLDEEGEMLLSASGSIDANALVSPLYRRLATRISSEKLLPPQTPRQRISLVEIARAPYFCSGCPHNTSTKVPEGALVGGGIGCHGMTQFMDPNIVGNVATTTHMGSEGTQWIGIAPFVDEDHMFQNIGDGTFFHSGQLAVQASVAAGTHITYKLLYNDAIAMTGGQDTAESNSLPVSAVAEILLRQGVTRVLITTDDVKKYRHAKVPTGVEVWDRSRVLEAQERLSSAPGVTVLIHDQRCAAENRRDRKRGKIAEPETRVFINERVCEGCGDCGAKSNCLSVEPVETLYGRKTQINQDSCNKDYSCLNGDCPSFITVRPHRRQTRMNRHSDAQVRRATTADLTIPEPRMPTSENFVIRMPGIGGTGVVTTSQILGTAALMDGKFCHGLDQTGLSQKAGPVVSDLRISTIELEGTNKATQESVDLLLGFDLLVTSGPETLLSLAPGRTMAVISTGRVPTGSMVSNDQVIYPDTATFRASLEHALGSDHVWWVDAERSEGHPPVGSAEANIFLLGVAFQVGGVPLRGDSIEKAIRLNGVMVESNLAAFRAGRQSIVGAAPDDSTVPTKSTRNLPGHSHFKAASIPLNAIDTLERCAEDLVGYQNDKYAEKFVANVSLIASAERAIRPGSSVLTTRIATSLHKLMAYKDEYEVARLSLDAKVTDAVLAKYGPNARMYWNLYPPILREHGLKRKLKFGPWFRSVFVVLYKMRWVRGTKWDVFGRTELRQMERQLLIEFEKVISIIGDGLNEENFDVALSIAALPEMVRGYEDLKVRRATEYRELLIKQCQTFSGFDVVASSMKGAPSE